MPNALEDDLPKGLDVVKGETFTSQDVKTLDRRCQFAIAPGIFWASAHTERIEGKPGGWRKGPVDKHRREGVVKNGAKRPSVGNYVPFMGLNSPYPSPKPPGKMVGLCRGQRSVPFP